MARLVLLLLLVTPFGFITVSEVMGIGEVQPADNNDVKEAMAFAIEEINLKEASSLDTAKYKVVEIFAATKQVVTGMLYCIEFQACITKNLCDWNVPMETCNVTVWKRMWLSPPNDNVLKEYNCSPL
ncbi:cystatin-POGU1-like [Antedon mediterranea]|uniref:cystatin-POGU1-like n=1 Tax=Antedon mediterranea TaxID=105859 RepID=UPI003AF79D91